MLLSDRCGALPMRISETICIFNAAVINSSATLVLEKINEILRMAHSNFVLQWRRVHTGPAAGKVLQSPMQMHSVAAAPRCWHIAALKSAKGERERKRM